MECLEEGRGLCVLPPAGLSHLGTIFQIQFVLGTGKTKDDSKRPGDGGNILLITCGSCLDQLLEGIKVLLGLPKFEKQNDWAMSEDFF